VELVVLGLVALEPVSLVPVAGACWARAPGATAMSNNAQPVAVEFNAS
jgi:hypothetical protein